MEIAEIARLIDQSIEMPFYFGPSICTLDILLYSCFNSLINIDDCPKLRSLCERVESYGGLRLVSKKTESKPTVKTDADEEELSFNRNSILFSVAAISVTLLFAVLKNKA